MLVPLRVPGGTVVRRTPQPLVPSASRASAFVLAGVILASTVALVQVPPAEAAALCAIWIPALPASVATTLPGGEGLVTFGITTALVAGDQIRITFPAGTTWSGLAASDFRIRQVNAGTGSCNVAGTTPGTESVPTALTFPTTLGTCAVPPASGSGCPTLLLSIPGASLTTGVNAGRGQVVISLASSAEGKIRWPPTRDVLASLTVETLTSAGVNKDGPLSVSGINLALTQGHSWSQAKRDGAHTGMMPNADNPGNGLVTMQSLVAGGPVRSNLLVTDLDGDGVQDVVVGQAVGGTGTAMAVKVFERTGGPGTLLGATPAWQFNIPTLGTCALGQGTTNNGWINLAAGDLDGDNLPDLVVSYNYVTDAVAATCNDSGIILIKGTTGTNLGPIWNGNNIPAGCPQIPIIFFHMFPAVGDIDGIPGNEAVQTFWVGGTTNLPTAVAFRYVPASASIQCYPVYNFGLIANANGNPRVQTGAMIAELRASHPGKEVVMGRDDSNTAGLLVLCTPSATALNCNETQTMPSGVRGLAAADVTGDGQRDIVANLRGAGTTPNSFTVLQGTTGNLPWVSSPTAGGWRWHMGALGDVNGNQIPDIVDIEYSEFVDDVEKYGDIWAHTFSGGAVNLAGTWLRTPNTNSRLGGVLVDIGGTDRKLEFVVGSGEGAVVAAQFSATGGPSSLTSTTVPGGAPFSDLAVGDVNGDCTNDVLAGTNTGTVEVLGRTGSAPALPSAIANLLAVPTGDPAYSSTVPDKRVHLSWSAPATGGAPITAYKIYRSTTAGFAPSAASLLATLPATVMPGAPFPLAYAAPPTTYTDLAVSITPDPGNRYYYKVAATNCIGEAVASNQARADVILPAPVTGLSASVSGDPAYPSPVQVRLTWTAPDVTTTNPTNPNYNINCPWLEGYTITRTGGGGPVTTVVTPGAPPVTWPRATPAPLATLSNPNIPGPALAAPTFTYTDTSVTRGNTYTYEVRAVNCVGASALTSVVAPVTVPAVVTGITAVASGPPAYAGTLRVNLAWSAASPNNSNCNWMEGYRVLRGPVGGPYVQVATVPATTGWPKPLPPSAPATAPATTFSDTTVSLGSTYAYVVRAVNCAGESADSVPVQVAVTLPATPTGLTAVPFGFPAYSNVPGERGVRLAWTAPSANNANCNWMEGYRVYRGPVGGPHALYGYVPGTGWPRALPVTAPGVQPVLFVDTGVTLGSTYEYVVAGVNCVGEGAGTSAASATVQIPTAPGDLVVTPGDGQASLSWTAGTPQNPSCNWMEGYRVLRGPVGGPFAVIGTTPAAPGWAKVLPPSAPGASPATAYVDLSATNGATYEYVVEAVNCVGPSPGTPPVQAYIGPNTAPTMTGPASLSTTQNAAITLTGTSAPVAADAEVAGADRVRITVSANQGTVTLAQTTGLDFSCTQDAPVAPTPACAGDGTLDATMTFRSGLADANAALDGLTFRPPSSLCGPGAAMLTLTVNDEANRGYGGVLTDTLVVPVDITCVAFSLAVDPPTATVYTTLATFFAPDAAGGVGPFTCAWSASGSPAIAAPSDCTGTDITWTSSALGSQTVTLEMTDSSMPPEVRQAQATVQVALLNTEPLFVAGPDVVVNEGDPLQTLAWATGIAPGTDPAEAGQVLDFQIVGNTRPELFLTGPSLSPSGVLSFTPTGVDWGVSTITVRLHDNGGTAGGGDDTGPDTVFTITVVHINKAPLGAHRDYTATPVAQNQGTPTSLVVPAASGLLVGASDLHGGEAGENNLPLTAELVSPPSKGVLAGGVAADGSFTYEPDLYETGADAFAFRIRDALGAVSATYTAFLSIVDLPDPPVAMNDPATGCYTAAQSRTLVVPAPGILANDMDPDGDAITAAPEGALPVGLTVAADGGFTYTPPATGTTSFTYRASDGTLTSGLATVCFNVVVNQPPVSVFTLPATIVEGGSADFLEASTDDMGIVTWEWHFGDGDISYDQEPTHRYARAGVYTVKLKVIDAFGDYGESTQLYTVLYRPEPRATGLSPAPVAVAPPVASQPANRAPVVQAPADQLAEPGERVTWTALASDPDGDALTYRWTQVGGPTVSLEGTTTSTVTFRAPERGTVTLHVEVRDAGRMATDTVQLVVNVPATEIPPPAMSIETSDGSLTVLLRAVGDGPFTWDLGDGSEPRAGADIRYTYAQAGIYVVQVTSPSGTASESIVVGTTEPLGGRQAQAEANPWMVYGILGGVAVVVAVVAVLFGRPARKQ